VSLFSVFLSEKRIIVSPGPSAPAIFSTVNPPLRTSPDPAVFPAGLPYRHHPIRAQSGLRLLPSHPKRSPYRAPFTNTLKSGLFSKSGKIKRSHRLVLRVVFGVGWVFC
jgi:hypothetical protein